MNLDRAIEAATIAVAHDVGEGLVDGARDGAAVRGGKAQSFRETFEGAADDGEKVRVTGDLKAQEQRIHGYGALCMASRAWAANGSHGRTEIW